MSDSIFIRRQNTLKNSLAKRGFDGMLITNLTNIRYISGFTGSAATCLITPDRQVFISDGRYNEQSREQVKGFECTIGSDPHLEIVEKNNLIANGLRLAFEGDDVSVNQFKRMQEIFRTVKWESTNRIIEEIAVVKDQSELDAVQTAVDISDRIFTETFPMLKVGVTEKDIANHIAALSRKYSDGEAFPTIVAAGPNGALPHAVPTDLPLQNGDFIVIDAGVKYAGYHSDMTRTPLLGNPSEKQREVYEIVKAAQQAACDAAKAGVTCKELDSVARDYISDKGYGENFVHSTGHGLGLEVHTIPRVSQISEDILAENNVVTIEPGIYLPGWGGIRIEDDVVIKQDGCTILNQTTKELIALT